MQDGATAPENVGVGGVTGGVEGVEDVIETGDDEEKGDCVVDVEV